MRQEGYGYAIIGGASKKEQWMALQQGVNLVFGLGSLTPA